MDIDSNNPTLSGGEDVEEPENNPLLNESGKIEELKKGMCFTSKQEVHEFYAKYAKNLGFAIAYRTQNVRADGNMKYFGIESKVRATLQQDGRYKLTTVVLEYMYDLIPSDSRHFPMNKRIRIPVKIRLEINDEVGIGVSRNFHSIVVEAGGYEALTFDEQDARNHIENARRVRLGVGDAESVAFYFHRMQQENSNFYSAIDFDYDNALRSKVEKMNKADFKSRNKLYDCLTVYEFEKQFHAAYTNVKFKEVQVELKRLLYCHATLVNEEGSICTYHVKEAVLVGEKMKKVEFLVYFNSTEFEMQCVCRWFEFRGIMCAHSLSVLIERCIYEVPDKYICRDGEKIWKEGTHVF
ncbi:protein FAR1-RELATED SEQUENCE 9-like [Camellia sinensis]|uniref:protein FAR1-RELATED SEQUENCE 9-like n=1 Tax=Camellia sinensis TaxID=4442 RepID=UPI001035A8A0|nr:protein FAR1-RELATED SEQUENCE 9-like [Camellia sinensis]